MQKQIVIIGGGIAGLMNAYHLNKAGLDVCLIDDFKESASMGNAGFLSAFEKPPLSNPGVILNTLKLMILGKSPIIIHPKFDKKLYSWILKFAKNANKERLKKTLILFEKYGQISYDEYERIEKDENVSFDYHRDGGFLVFTDEKSWNKKQKSIQDNPHYEQINYKDAELDLGFVKDNVKAVLNLKRNARIDPKMLILKMREILAKKGVKIIQDEVVEIQKNSQKITSISTKNETFKADTFILATGANLSLAKKLDINLMLIPAKGYNLTFELAEELRPKKVVMFNDLFVIITPRKNDIRMTSKLEIGGMSSQLQMKRIESILANIKPYCKDFSMTNPKPWTGFRPLTPNDMPLIGRDERIKNLVYAMGYGWLGITFGAAISQILTNLIVNELENKQSDDILLFSGFFQD